MPSIDEIKQYTPPRYHSGKESYIDYYAFDPAQKKMRRKKIKLNSIKNSSLRRKYANKFIDRLHDALSRGWNPWVDKEDSNAYMQFSEVVRKYRMYIDKMTHDGNYRQETHKSYASYLKNMVDYNDSAKNSITFIYQFDKDFCVRLLDEVYIVRDNTAYTRDNYLAFLKSFSTFCINKNYLKANPTEGLKSIGRRGKKKIRTTIDQHQLEKLTEYLKVKNKHYLLASYLLYYCFIRPAEMARLRISSISLDRQTIYLQDTITKNRKDGTITLPAKVIRLMLELDIFSHPSNSFLFSRGFMPGEVKCSEKMFRDWWAAHVRKDLKFPVKYKFYSLKDTGITNMLRHNDVLSVRDQARHSSILMTDIYTPHDIQEANELIKNYEDSF